MTTTDIDRKPGTDVAEFAKTVGAFGCDPDESCGQRDGAA